MNVSDQFKPLRIHLTGFTAGQAARLPVWNDSACWEDSATEEFSGFEYSVIREAVEPGSNCVFLLSTPLIGEGKKTVRIITQEVDEEAALDTIAHALVLPAIRPGLIGVDYQDFVSALKSGNDGMLYHWTGLAEDGDLENLLKQSIAITIESHRIPCYLHKSFVTCKREHL